MTYNEKKSYLESYGYNMRRIKRLQQEYEEWETIGTNITQKFSNTPIKMSGNQSKIEKCAIHLANIQDQILQEMEEAEYTRREIENLISTIRDSRRREIIELRFLKGVPVSKIAHKYGKDANNIHRTIRKTITNIVM